MYVLRLKLGVALLGLIGAAVVAGAPPAGPSPADEKLLRTAQVGLDGPALLAYFRQRTVGEADRQRIERLIRQLGDPAYALRERATAELIACGLPAIGPLRQAQADPDVEIARRADHCLARIERVPSTALSAAAARLIAQKRPAGAVGVLLAYLPLADDETVADEVREAIAAAAMQNGRPDPLLEQALEDPLPVKRGAAVEALVRTGRPEAVELSRKALADGNPDVRLRAALALVTRAKDRQTVPALITLLGELPQGAGWRAEEVLIRLAGDQSPKVALGSDEESRQKCRDAWMAWWQKNGPGIDLARLDGMPALLGHTLLVLRDRSGLGGSVLELNPGKAVVWKIEGLQQPVDAVVVAQDRVLIAEQNAHQVSERDFSGKVIWSKQVMMPVGVERLPNGHTLITSRNQVIELDEGRHSVFGYTRPQMDIIAAQKLRSGEVVVLTNAGNCIRLDAQGKEIKTFATAQSNFDLGQVEALPNGRLLLTQRSEVAEFSPDGHKQWSVPYSWPSSVQRLPNGNTLVASIRTQRVAELDAKGQPVWEYQPADGRLPCRARRR